MQNVNFSIIIPMYNSERSISRCIESLLNQSYTAHEIIIVDDGSSDKSYNICNEFSKGHSSIKLYQQLNSGASTARNRGLNIATGDYIIFVDADDYVEKDFLLNFYEIIISTNADFILTGFYIDKVDSDTGSVHIKTAEVKNAILKNRNEICNVTIDLLESERMNAPWAKAIKLRIIRDNNLQMPEHIVLQEDLYFNFSALNSVECFVIINKPTYHYIVGNENSVTGRYFRDKFENLDEVHDLVLEFYEKYGDDYLIARAQYIYIKNLYSGVLNLFHPKCTLERNEKLNYIRTLISREKHKAMVASSFRPGIKYLVLKSVLNTNKAVWIYYFTKLLYFLKKHLKLHY